MSTTSVAVQGLAELNQLLQTLPAQVEFNVLRSALRAGQKVVQQAAVQGAPVQSGALRSSIRLASSRSATRRGVARVDLKAGDKTAWYAHIIESGSGSHYSGTGTRSKRRAYKIQPRKGNGALLFGGQLREAVTHPGVKPRHFMRNAAEQLDKAALDAFAAYVRQRLPREIKAMNKGAPSA